MSAAEAEIIKNYGQVSVEQKIDMAEQMAEQAAQMYASAWAQCPEIKMPHDPQLN
ncbi:MAG TPA: hypothetical protein VHY30_10340 [Verrucomicrobiae bacterium]|jgi:hypothetical protein|nr:hypothetical protein [Verrucomicrobiae bacterium]